MNILLDMNLSPSWAATLERGGHKAVHWSDVGSVTAPDNEIMEWAKTNQFVVFTYDLDFGAILASTQAQGPSVIQLRDQDISPQTSGVRILQLLETYQQTLEEGALVILDSERKRIRILPVNR